GKTGEVPDLEERAPEQLDRLEAEHLGHAMRDESDDEVAVGLPDPVRGEAGDVLKPLVGERQLATGGAELADVLELPGDAAKRPARTVDAGVPHAQMHPRGAVELDGAGARDAATCFEIGENVGKGNQQRR